MEVVVDTNVLVSAILRNREPEAVITFILSDAEFEWVASSAILLEYREVLARPKFALPEAILTRWLRLLDDHVVVIPVDLELDLPRDQKDAKFLSCAAAAGAQLFVTGDRDFSDAQRLLKTLIISVSQFKRFVCDRPSTDSSKQDRRTLLKEIARLGQEIGSADDLFGPPRESP
jgi:putative PIN family toxin of toxin-antitoxin system